VRAIKAGAGQSSIAERVKQVRGPPDPARAALRAARPQAQASRAARPSSWLCKAAGRARPRLDCIGVDEPHSDVHLLGDRYHNSSTYRLQWLETARASLQGKE